MNRNPAASNVDEATVWYVKCNKVEPHLVDSEDDLNSIAVRHQFDLPVLAQSTALFLSKSPNITSVRY